MQTKEVIFTQLYENNIDKVFRYVYYRVRDIKTAEDLTSVTFEKALSKFDTFAADKASILTWLITIARNTIIDHVRKTKAEPAIVWETTSESSEEKVIKTEENERLLTYITKLAEKEQEVISLKFGSCLTNRQIAKVLNLTESNVSTIIYRSIRKLKDMFSKG